ncbi:MAG: RluA family pseudouridine synthase [Erysipelotrichales bacterium]|nr:RluA family pseudouridine synthase [Erysipelotrichales bacterium]
MKHELTYVITAPDTGKKVKDFLAASGLSRREITRIFQTRGICLNGESCRLTQTLAEGDSLIIVFPYRDAAKQERMSGIPEILYEDEYLVLVNKPRGMACHSSREHKSDDLGTLLQNYLGKNHPVRAVGRLDKDVSGIMLYAKTKEAAAALSRMKDAGEIRKEYLAVAGGMIDPPEGTWTYGIEIIPGEKARRVSDKGKPCVTLYSVEKSYPGVSLVRVTIRTGRSHQIRAGFAHYGHPLVGDSLYGGDTAYTNRALLSACHLVFKHPFAQKTVDMSVPIPEDMEEYLSFVKEKKPG